MMNENKRTFGTERCDEGIVDPIGDDESAGPAGVIKLPEVSNWMARMTLLAGLAITVTAAGTWAPPPTTVTSIV